MIQKSDGVGGLGEPLLLGESGISQSNADSRYYINDTPLNSIILANNTLNLNNNRISNLSDAILGTDALNR